MALITDKKDAQNPLPGIPGTKIQLGGIMRKKDDSINLDLKETRHEVKSCWYRP
jgi:hypothetical protein